MPQHESADYLASDSGQYTSMPPVVPAGHPMGPYAPRPIGRLASTQPDSGVWLATPTGQNFSQSGGSNAPIPAGPVHSAPAPKGQASDVIHQASPVVRG